MNLEQLPKTLLELKDKIVQAANEEAATIANTQLIVTLNERATKGSGSKQKNQVNSQAAQKLNQQQQKFLKQMPQPEQERQIVVEAKKQDGKYVITANGNDGSVSVSPADLENYRKTISEQVKRTFDKL